jgi:AcrR family transcriptional regulator
LIIRDTLRFPANLAAAASEDRLRARLRWFFTVLGIDAKAAGLVLVVAPSAGSSLTARTRIANRALERFIGTELAAVSNSTPIPRPLVHGAAAAALQLARSQLLSARPAPTAAVANEFADWLISLDGGGSRGLWDFETRGLPWRVDLPTSARVRAIGDDRGFLVAATTKICMRDGYAKLTVPAICREAGVPRRAFDECFRGLADCYLAAVETRIAATWSRAEAHASGADSWERGVVRVIASICGELRQDPALGRLALLEVLAPGAPGAELRERILGRWARRLRRTAPRAVRPGQPSADASVAAAVAIVVATKQKRLDRAVPRAAFTILAPMIGSAGAEEAIIAELRAQTPVSESKNI